MCVLLIPNIEVVTTTDHVGLTESYIEYIYRDHLGSVETVTDEDGNLLLSPEGNYSFDAFGGRRKADWSRGLNYAENKAILDSLGVRTRRGFTGHEHLDRTGIIHMNGRIYDPLIGRFMSPDPLVQDATYSQSWNRYAYAFNNPLARIDLSGFDSEFDFDLDLDFGENLNQFEVGGPAPYYYDYSQYDSDNPDYYNNTNNFTGLNPLYFARFDNSVARDSSDSAMINSGAAVGVAQKGIWEGSIDHLKDKYNDFVDGISNILSADGSLQVGHAGAFTGCAISACLDLSISLGISIDFDDLLNSKILFQSSSGVGAGLGIGFVASRGYFLGRGVNQLDTGLYGSHAHTAFGYGAVDGVGAAYSIDWQDGSFGGGTFGGIGVGLGGGFAPIGERFTFNAVSGSLRDIGF